MAQSIISLVTVLILAIIVAGVSLVSFLRIRHRLATRERELQKHLYEAAILRELGERIGYSLDVKKIVDIITGSLRQFLDYTAVAYLIRDGERLSFKCQLEASVNRPFVDAIKQKAIASLAELTNEHITAEDVDEALTGAILVRSIKTPVSSLFNIPLVIRDEPVGIITVASTEKDRFKPEDMTLLYEIANQASRAVTKLQAVIDQEQHKTNAMVASLTDGIVMLDNNFGVLVANPVARQILHLPQKSDVTAFDIIDSFEGVLDLRTKIEEALEMEEVVSVDSLLINERFLEVLISPVKARSGHRQGEKPLGAVILLHDITKEKMLEKMRDDFNSMLVHELRSPLGGIRRITTLLKQEEIANDSAKRTEFLSLITKSTEDMLRLVNDLLDVAKIEAGKFSVIKTPVNIRAILEQAIAQLRPVAEQKHINIGLDYADNIPAKIAADDQRIKQVIVNLISNAIKFTPQGGKIHTGVFIHEPPRDINEEAKVIDPLWHATKLGPEYLPPSLVITISDTGAGISEEGQKKLFNKFQQLISSARSGERGSGLGLLIAKGIIETHGGTVNVASEEGNGSTFYFTLPLSVSSQKAFNQTGDLINNKHL